MDIASFIGIAGIALSALLGSIGYLFKVRAEQKRSSKNVLYYLLEIRHSLLLNHINPDELSKSYLEFLTKWSEENSLEQPQTLPESFAVVINSFFRNLYISQSPSINEQVINQFHLALLELSKDDPILSYRIKGKEKLSELIDIQNQYETEFQLMPEIANDPFASKFISNHFHQRKSENIDDIVADLDHDISLVSKKCGVITHLECKRILKKSIHRKVDFEELGIEKELGKILKDIQLSQAQL